MFYRLRYLSVLLTVLILFGSQVTQSVSAQKNALLKKPVSFSCTNCTVIRALLDLGKISGTSISFSDSLLAPLPLITIKVDSTPIGQVIKKITQGVKVKQNVVNDLIFLEISPLMYTFTGKLRNERSKETLAQATINVFKGSRFIGAFTTTDQGIFSMNLPKGTYRMDVSYAGNDFYRKTVTINGNRIDDLLITVAGEITEVVISATDQLAPVNGNTVPGENGRRDLLLGLPGYLPQKMPGGDIGELLGQTAGVLSGVDGLGGLHIRGGNADQNMFLLDDVPVYNPSHSLGLLSSFNAAIIKSASVWKGDAPAQYGGRASSVVDICTRDGNMSELSGGIAMNMFSNAVFLEGPIVKDKCSVLASGRLSNFRPLIKRISTPTSNVLNADFRQLDYVFYDYNFKINYKFGKKNNVYLSIYGGNDEFKAPITQRQDAGNAGSYFDTIDLHSTWGNQILALRWNHLYNEKLFSHTTISGSKFKYNSELHLTTDNITPDGRQTRVTNYVQIYNTDILDYAIRHDLSWVKSNKFRLNTGINAILHRSNPGALSLNFQIPGQTQNIIDSLQAGLVNKEKLRASEVEYYVGSVYRFRKKFTLDAGVNASVFSIDTKQYWSVLPKLRLSYKKDSLGGMQYWASYDRMAQYMHQIGSFNIGLPFELWVPSTAKVKPERVELYAAGLGWTNQKWSFSAEVYQKYLNTVLVLLSASETIISGSTENTNGWEDRIISGKGSSRGLEIMAEKKTGRLKGLLAYTLSKTDRTFPDLNDGKTFPFQFDRRHDCKGNANWTFYKWLNISLTGNYISGNPITLAGVKYNHQIPDPDIPQKPKEVFVYPEVNGYRLPWIIRWDAAVNFDLESHAFQKRQKHKIQLGVINGFNRKNPFYQFLNLNSTNNTNKNAIQYTLLPRMPFINYEMTF